MDGRNQGWARDFFGPLWTWLVMGVGFVLIASAYGLYHMGFTYVASLVTFTVGAGIMVAMLTYLCA